MKRELFNQFYVWRAAQSVYYGGAFVERQMRLPLLLVEGKFYLIVLSCRG